MALACFPLPDIDQQCLPFGGAPQGLSWIYISFVPSMWGRRLADPPNCDASGALYRSLCAVLLYCLICAALSGG